MDQHNNKPDVAGIFREIRRQVIESYQEPLDDPSKIANDLKKIKGLTAVDYYHPLTSYRPYLRVPVFFLKKVIRRILKWLFLPLFERQSQFNQGIWGSVASLDKKISLYKPDQPLLIDNLSFEDRFRGSRQDVKNKQLFYLPYYAGRDNVLDIGCGRGEFLELLQENGIQAVGVDSDQRMVDFCLKKGFRVRQGDGISYLHQTEDNSLGGIFLGQVIEHLPPADLIEMIRLCNRKLRPGSYLIAETPNPQSLCVYSHAFYIDMTHLKPVHPLTAEFIFSAAGFRNVTIEFMNYPLDEKRLSTDFQGGSVLDDQMLAALKQNFQLLNEEVFGPQDYAAVGLK